MLASRFTSARVKASLRHMTDIRCWSARSLSVHVAARRERTRCRKTSRASAMLGIVSEEDDDGNAASGRKTKGPGRGVKDAGVKPGPTAGKKAAPADHVPLSQLLADLGLSELTPCYRAYLRKEYGCSTDKITVEQYEEQKAMLETCKQEPLKLRNLMRTLHGFM